MSLPSFVAFGPQSTWPSPNDLSQIRSDLLSEPHLSPLVDAIKELDKVWKDLVEHCPRLDSVSGLQSINRIQRWIDQKEDPSLAGLAQNVLLAPFTVIQQMIQYFRFLRNRQTPRSHAALLKNVQDAGIQGVCIGLLSAMVLCSSADEEALGRNCATALRLAFCIGAFVDMDGEVSNPAEKPRCIVVRCKDQSSTDQLLQLLEKYEEAYISVISDHLTYTLTVSGSVMPTLASELLALDLGVANLQLSGRFHSQIHCQNAKNLVELCKINDRLRFRFETHPLAPLRSNSNGGVVHSRSFYEVAITNILVEVSNWRSTLAASLPLIKPAQRKALVVGSIDCISPSIKRQYNLTVMRANELEPFNGRLELRDFASHNTADAENYNSEKAIAVIGMACKFPGANSLQEFWQVMESGRSMLQEIPPERFQSSNLRRDTKAKMVFWGNFVDSADAFDHKFFKKTSLEAASMDPQQRLLLEVAYQAMESSGYFGQVPVPFQGDRPAEEIGCFIGCGTSDYNDNVASHPPSAYSATGTLRAFLSGRISHHFGWTGPSITYDTACSSSLVAIHSACKSLELGECSTAVAGGVNVITSPHCYQNLRAGSFLSETGQTKAFDDKADGYCRADGVGLVVLKKLDCAISDRDNIIGVIAGSAINQNSNATSITVPDLHSQVKLFKKVLSLAELDPSCITFAEAHGTGTQLGDTTEAESIRTAFGGEQRAHKVYIGSVKSNIGHTEGASGVAGLIKTLLMIQRGKIPMQANFSTQNRRIPPLEPDNIEIPRTTSQWATKFRAACVNNYGAAGSNAALVVCQPPARARQNHELRYLLDEYPIFLAGHSMNSLNNYRFALLKRIDQLMHRMDDLKKHNILASLAFNLAAKQNREFPYRYLITTKTLADLRAQLSVDETPSKDKLVLSELPKEIKPIVLCFGGQSRTGAYLGEDMFNSSAILRYHLCDCDNIVRSLGPMSIIPDIFQHNSSKDLVQLNCMQFSLQYATAKTWIDCGLQVQALIGHSFGQITALCVSGAISLEDGLRFVAGRALLIQSCCTSDPGSMIAIEADLDTVKSIIQSVRDIGSDHLLDIACYNSSTSYVLSGASSSIKIVEDIVAEKEAFKSVRSKRLDLQYAFHSHLLDPISEKLSDLAKTLTYHEMAIPVETCSESQNWAKVEPHHLAKFTRLPVYFRQAVKRLSQRLGSCLWLEAGARSPITVLIQRALGSSTSSQQVFLPMYLDSPGLGKSLVDNTIRLWKEGHVIEFWPFHRSQRPDYVEIDLPPYQFEKSKHYLAYVDGHASDSTSEPSEDSNSSFITFVKFQDADKHVAELKIDPGHERFRLLVKGHAVLDIPLCPAGLYVDIAVQAALKAFEITSNDESQHFIPTLEDLQIHTPLGSDTDSTISIILHKERETVHEWYFELNSQKFARDSVKGSLLQHATGVVTFHLPTDLVNQRALASFERLVNIDRVQKLVQEEITEAMHGDLIYYLFDRIVRYSAFYKGVHDVFSNGHEIVGHLQLPYDEATSLHPGMINPLEIDNFLQVAGLHMNFLAEHPDNKVFIAAKIDAIRAGPVYMETGLAARKWSVYSNFVRERDVEVVNDIFVFDSINKKLAMVLQGVHFTEVPIPSLTKMLKVANATRMGPVTDSRDTPHQQVTPQNTLHEAAGTISQKPNDDPAFKDSKLSKQVIAVKELLKNIVDVPLEALSDEATFDELGVDSLMIAQITSELSENFDIEISLNDFKSFKDIQSLCDFLFPSSAKGTALCSSSDDSSSATTGNSGAIDHSTTDWRSTSMSSVSFSEDSLILSADDIQKTFKNVSKTFDEVSNSVEYANFWSEVYPMQFRLVTAYVVEAFAKLGCSLTTLAPGEKLCIVQTAAKHSQVVRRLHEILKEARLIAISDGDFVRTDRSVDGTASSELYASILEKYPQHASSHQLLRQTGSKLSECLSGKSDAVQILWSSKENRALMEDFYTNAPVFKTATKLLCDTLVNIFSQCPNGQTVHILEVGAGTGGTTKDVLDYLLHHDIKFTYEFTDISSSLVAKAKRNFANFESVNFSVLDVEKAIPEHLYGQYHTVISTNCIHATESLSKSCNNIRRMLRNDGFLALIELTRNVAWFDLVFGLLEGWWLFKDGRKHALADELRWEKALTEAGFRYTDWSDGSSRESQSIRVILGCASKPIHTKQHHRASSLLLQGDVQRAQTFMFLFPGGFGTAATYAPLPKLLDDVAVYGLNSPFVNNAEDFNVPLAEFASLYVAEIRRVKPQGPYTIMGYSAGGVIAYEAARQMINMGDEVEQLFLIDSACPLAVPPFPLSLLDFFDSIDRFTGEDAEEGGEEHASMTDLHVKATIESLTGYTPASIPDDKSLNTTLFRARDGVDKQNKVTNIEASAEEQKVIEWVLRDRDESNTELGWDRLVTRDHLSVIHVDGNHFSVMTDPYITTLACEIRRCLRQHT